ncbi:hypothetical protein D8L93_04755 [Sodalis-like symbiont of Bactericera trigonica]|nr:hypothetical protein D8L93_04755 [Sodalis-like symbiont of Bactericera trigonica]
MQFLLLDESFIRRRWWLDQGLVWDDAMALYIAGYGNGDGNMRGTFAVVNGRRKNTAQPRWT